MRGEMPDMSDTTQQNTEVTPTNTEVTPFDAAAFLAAQPEEARKGLEAHIETTAKGLKTALDSEREARKDLEKQLKTLQGKAEKGGELEQAIEKMRGELVITNKRNAFLASAPKDLEYIKEALAVAEVNGLIADDGKVDWESFKKSYAGFFAKPVAAPAPQTNASAAGRDGGLSAAEIVSRKKANGAYTAL
jgi:hypothetical protein